MNDQEILAKSAEIIRNLDLSSLTEAEKLDTSNNIVSITKSIEIFLNKNNLQ